MNKIEALKATIVNLESGRMHYYWSDPNTCNCGVLARTICNAENIFSIGFADSPISDFTLTAFARHALCMTTGLPLPVIFQSLRDCGFTHQDIFELENLSNVRIAKLIHQKVYLDDHNRPIGINRSVKHVLIQYLKAWVSILVEENTVAPIAQEPIPEPKVKKEYVTVRISESIYEGIEDRVMS